MIVTLHTQGLQTFDDIRAFVTGSQAADFEIDSRDDAYRFVRDTLRRFGYRRCRRADKGLLRRDLITVTGLSRAQITRLIGQYRQSGGVRDRRGAPARPFARRYTRADVAALADLDGIHGQLSGPATRKLCERAWHGFGERRYQRLASISNGHLYNLRHRADYRRRRGALDQTQPTRMTIAERRRPEPEGQPGYLRVDSVHQGDLDGIKGPYHINLVDAVTQYAFVGSIPRINEAFLLPLLEDLINAFAFKIHGFHADNGGEYINHRVAGLLDKLRVTEFTKSRARQTTVNALVESKNAAVVRKHLGYEHIPGKRPAIPTIFRSGLCPAERVSFISGGRAIGVHLKHVDTTTRSQRRRYSDGYRRQVVAETWHASESVSEVARRHDPNTNLVFKWRRRYPERTPSADASSSPGLIPKSYAGPGLLAHVLGRKYADHLPLYRQSRIYARDGVALDVSTRADWVGQASALARPLVEAIARHVMAGAKLHADDTPVPVLKPGRGRTKTGRLWTYVRDDRNSADFTPPAVRFCYTPDRKGERPRKHLKFFAGTLQADGYAGFSHLYEAGTIHEAECWAHARRKFFECHQVTDSPIAADILERIQTLYVLEAGIRGQPAERRRAARQSDARPALDALKAQLIAARRLISAKSALAGAINYVLSRWPALTRYCDDGALEIDNNIAENALRCVALGRKNYLFAGADSGGERAASIYTLIGTALLNDVNPQSWLRHVLERIADLPISRVHELLPWHVKDKLAVDKPSA